MDIFFLARHTPACMYVCMHASYYTVAPRKAIYQLNARKKEETKRRRKKSIIKKYTPPQTVLNPARFIVVSY